MTTSMNKLAVLRGMSKYLYYPHCDSPANGEMRVPYPTGIDYKKYYPAWAAPWTEGEMYNTITKDGKIHLRGYDYSHHNGDERLKKEEIIEPSEGLIDLLIEAMTAKYTSEEFVRIRNEENQKLNEITRSKIVPPAERWSETSN